MIKILKSNELIAIKKNRKETPQKKAIRKLQVGEG